MVPKLSEETLARFWAKVNRGDSEACWLWKAGRNEHGYGVFHYRVGGKQWGGLAHRVMVFVTTGEWPREYVLHRCDTPACVNPAHLWIGSQADNLRDMRGKGRGNRGDKNGHASLTENDVREIRRLVADRLPQKEIARLFGITRVHVRRIALRLRWSHLK